MTFSTIATQTFTDAVLTRLRSNAESILVGDGDGDGVDASFPYAVLNPELSTELSDEGGVLSDPMAHRSLEWQITSVGRSREQAQWCSDIMRAILQATPFTTSGRNVWRVDVEGLGEIERDDDVNIGDVTGSLFYANDSISIMSAPA